MSFVKLLRTSFLTERLGWLLLYLTEFCYTDGDMFKNVSKIGKQMFTWKIASVYFIRISMKTKKIVIFDFNIEVKTN